jgi:hypothetical protein
VLEWEVKDQNLKGSGGGVEEVEFKEGLGEGAEELEKAVVVARGMIPRKAHNLSEEGGGERAERMYGVIVDSGRSFSFFSF